VIILKEEVKEHFSWEDDFEEKEEKDEQVEEPEEIKEEKVKEEKKTKKKKKARKKRKKKGRAKKFIWTIIILIIAVSLFIVYKGSIFPEKEITKTVAIVNDQPISSVQLDLSYKLFVPEEMKSIISKDYFLKDSLVIEVLLIQEAEKEGIYIEDYEVDFYIDELMGRLGATKAQFISDIEKEGLSFDEIKEAYRTKITIAELLDEKISSKIEITEQEIKDYYDNNKQEYSAKQGQIRISHILIEKIEEAENILKELKEGADFSKTALEKSTDPSAKLNKGELGFIEKGQMVPEFEEAAFSLKIGELSEPVKSAYGYHIVKRGNDELSFEEAKDNINLSLFTAKQQSVLETYIEQLKSKADIVLYPEETDTVLYPEEEDIELYTEEETTFKTTTDEICKKDGKPVIRMFSASIDYHSKWVTDSFNEIVNEYEGRIMAHNWEIDSGDDLLTEKIEEKIPKAEFDIYRKYNNAGTVPTFVFGCKYTRIGNGYEAEDDLLKEKAEFREIIESLI